MCFEGLMNLPCKAYLELVPFSIGRVIITFSVSSSLEINLFKSFGFNCGCLCLLGDYLPILYLQIASHKCG